MGIRCYMLESRRKKPDGPRLNFSAEEAVEYQLDALKHNANLVKIMELRFMYRDLILTVGQFERFRRIFHHSTYRVLLEPVQATSMGERESYRRGRDIPIHHGSGN
ncbi:hypothetical protein LINPERPRIM_LOCUS18910 [Linum perenne]